METVNKVLYPIQRFRIAGYLSQVERADYKSIAEFTGLSYPEISKNVKVLEEWEYVNVQKIRSGRYAQTVVELSAKGRSELKKLVQTLRRLAPH